jgi:predicted nucleic-acid-binding Zn-ribbon protein
MKTGQCPMCKSTEVYINETHHFFLDLHADFSQKEKDPLGSVQDSLVAYICKNCSFTAFYAKDIVNDLDDLTQKEVGKGIVNTFTIVEQQ